MRGILVNSQNEEIKEKYQEQKQHLSEDRVMRLKDMRLVIKRFLENMNSEKNGKKKDKSD